MEDQELIDFAARLNDLCDEMGIPPKHQARQIELARLFGVSPRGAAKWLEAESFPSQKKKIAIAKWGNVQYEWLTTGRHPKRVPIYTIDPHAARVFAAMEKMDEAQKAMLERISESMLKPDAKASNG